MRDEYILLDADGNQVDRFTSFLALRGAIVRTLRGCETIGDLKNVMSGRVEIKALDSVEGFDGGLIAAGDRVELHPACELWMRGARYGDVTKIGFSIVEVQLDNVEGTRRFHRSKVRRVE